MKRTLAILALAAAGLAGAPASAQTPGDDSDLETLTVLEVDPAANEIRVRETGTTRIRTLELDERSVVTGGSVGGRMDFRDLRPGDTIRVPGAVGSVSDRVRASEVQVLAAPREGGGSDAGVGAGPGARSRRAPSTLQPDPDSPSAIGRDPTTGGRVGADPGATGEATRGTGSQTGSGTSPGTGRSVGPTGTGQGTGSGTRGGTGGGTGSTGTTGTGGSGAGMGGAGGP